MPLEGVVHALRNIHSALRPDGILVDTQPVSGRPSVAADGAVLGTLDMRDWLTTIGAVDELLAETIGAGLFELEHEQRFLVADTFDDAEGGLETVTGWRGTHVPTELARRIRCARPPLTVQQEIRLRLLRRR